MYKFRFVKSLGIVVLSCYLHLTVIWIPLLGKTALGKHKEKKNISLYQGITDRNGHHH